MRAEITQSARWPHCARQNPGPGFYNPKMIPTTPVHQPRSISRALRGTGMALAAALALGGLTLSPGNASLASAAEPENSSLVGQEFVFTSPSGSNWTVPAGVSVVVVGLRGGTGGGTWGANGGRGADFAVRVPVKTGDVLTVYAGQHATGKNDKRDGGKGFINGGTGGKGSLSGSHGGGGGGAGAVKLNGELIAVAAGGGGGGGYSGKPNIGIKDLTTAFEAAGGYKGLNKPEGSFTHISGGEGAALYRGGVSGATAGQGSTPGAIGENGKDQPSFAGYRKSGTGGGNAGYFTGGGGGGGGGGGWPASGTGGGGGRKFQHYAGGSGGGAGMNWVKSGVPGLQIDSDAQRPEDMHDYFGPLAAPGTAKIFVPVTTTIKASAPIKVQLGQDLPLRVRTADTRVPNAPLRGSILITEGDWQMGKDTYRLFKTTSGDQTISVPTGTAPKTQLNVGTHTLTVSYWQSQYDTSRDYQPTAQTTVTFEVVAPEPDPDPVTPGDASAGGEGTSSGDGTSSGEQTADSQASSDSGGDGSGQESDAQGTGDAESGSQDADPAPEPPTPTAVSTTTELTLDNAPTHYGDLAWLTTKVTPSGASLSMIGAAVTLEVDGIDHLTMPLLPPLEEGIFTSFLPATLPVGTHLVRAKYLGTTGDGVGDGGSLPSASETLQIVIERAPTATAITSAPSTVSAFEPFDVEATVTKTGIGTGFDGSAVLLANGSPLMYVDLDADTARFEGVVAPPGTTELTVAYLGDAAGNFALSTSPVSAITLTDVATQTTLEQSTHVARADQAVTFTATVTNVSPSHTEDPRGELEVLFDGEVVLTIPTGLDDDPESGDGEARFEIEGSGFTLGTHDVQARFVPAQGFAESQSPEGENSLQVLGIETVLTPEHTQLSGTPGHPVTVRVNATVADDAPAPASRAASPAAAGDPVDGYVQAFVGDTPLGDPFEVEHGQADIALSGLGVGTHEVELRFTAFEAFTLRSAATVQVRVTADASTGTGLSNTGGVNPAPLLLGAAALLALGAGALILRRKPTKTN